MDTGDRQRMQDRDISQEAPGIGNGGEGQDFDPQDSDGNPGDLDPLGQRAMALYQQGQAAFEWGEYRQAVTALEEAVRWAKPSSRLGGEISLWLVNAYSAAGEAKQAETLGEALARHPHWETRKQSQRLLHILKAPRLQLKPEWRTQIPDLTNLEEGGDGSPRLSAYPTPSRRPRPAPAPEPEPEDLSQLNTQDNGFLWVALGAIALFLATLAWLT